MIKRYLITGWDFSVDEEDDGEWVKYEDVALAIQLWETMMRMKDK